MRPLLLSCSTGKFLPKASFLSCSRSTFSCNMTWELSGQCIHEEG